MATEEGWIAGARRVASPNSDSRPAGTEISLVVLHSISLPRGHYRKDAGGKDAGSAIERLFTNRLDPAEHPSFADLAGFKVSAHFLIYRSGELLQFVPLQQRAWHAGASRWRGRERCNDFSVGIELEGVDDGRFAAAQYASLAGLLRKLQAVLPLQDIAAHSDVAPGRKSDPGTRFDWLRVAQSLARSA